MRGKVEGGGGLSTGVGRVSKMKGNLQLPAVEGLAGSQGSVRDMALGRLTVINSGDHA